MSKACVWLQVSDNCLAPLAAETGSERSHDMRQCYALTALTSATQILQVLVMTVKSTMHVHTANSCSLPKLPMQTLHQHTAAMLLHHSAPLSTHATTLEIQHTHLAPRHKLQGSQSCPCSHASRPPAALKLHDRPPHEAGPVQGRCLQDGSVQQPLQTRRVRWSCRQVLSKSDWSIAAWDFAQCDCYIASRCACFWLSPASQDMQALLAWLGRWG